MTTTLTVPQLKLLHWVNKVEKLGGEFPITGGVERRVADHLRQKGLLERYNYGRHGDHKHRYYGYAKLTPAGKQVADQNPLPD